MNELDLRYRLNTNHPVIGKDYVILSDDDILSRYDETGCVSTLLSLNQFEDWIKIWPTWKDEVGKTIKHVCENTGDADGHERVFRRAKRLMPKNKKINNCSKCNGERWLWRSELDEPYFDPQYCGIDDTKYTCDVCYANKRFNPATDVVCEYCRELKIPNTLCIGEDECNYGPGGDATQLCQSFPNSIRCCRCSEIFAKLNMP